MKIIEGRDVDLISPFPPKEMKRIFGWMRCYKTITETTNFPKTEDELVAAFAKLTQTHTFGIIDKNNILGVRHEAPLIGIYTWDQDTICNGNLHVASTRKAWGSRLVDQAGQLLAQHLFDTQPNILRATVSVLQQNAPAKALAKRLGFRYEGCFRDAIEVNGDPQNMAIFGLTRRDWENQGLGKVTIEPTIARKNVEERSTPNVWVKV